MERAILRYYDCRHRLRYTVFARKPGRYTYTTTHRLLKRPATRRQADQKIFSLQCKVAREGLEQGPVRPMQQV